MKKSYLDKDSSDPSLPMNRVAQSQWNDICSAPKDGEDVWLGTAKRVAVGYWYGKMGWIGMDCEKIPWEPTHWQEYFTPDPPIETRYNLPGHDETMAGLRSLTIRKE